MNIRNVFEAAARSCPKIEWFRLSQSIKNDSDKFQLGIEFFPKAEIAVAMETLAMVLQGTPRLQCLYASRIKVDSDKPMRYNNVIASAIMDQAGARIQRDREARAGSGSATSIFGDADEPLEVEGHLWNCQDTLQILDIGMDEEKRPEKYNFFEGFVTMFTKLTTLILRLDEFCRSADEV
ncbi:hypothetical protein BGZ51_002290 [Haplosporangium sp. Z 767]|nr:hypothetical protein BGZ51_002290 [Haplosporangium sp. Z 767]